MWPFILFLLAVAAIVGLVRVESLAGQILFAWLVAALIGAFTLTSTGESGMKSSSPTDQSKLSAGGVMVPNKLLTEVFRDAIASLPKCEPTPPSAFALGVAGELRDLADQIESGDLYVRHFSLTVKQDSERRLEIEVI